MLAATFGVVDAFFYPALNTIVPMLVPDRQLAPANAVVQELGPGHGAHRPGRRGAFIALVETGPAFVIDAASFGVAALAIALVAGGRRASPSRPPSAPSVLARRRRGSARRGRTRPCAGRSS